MGNQIYEELQKDCLITITIFKVYSMVGKKTNDNLFYKIWTSLFITRFYAHLSSTTATIESARLKIACNNENSSNVH